MTPQEAQRLKVLHEYQVLDTEPEVAFDRIVALAQRLFKVPIVLVSLVAEERQWFKACYGLDIRETSRDVSFCAHAIRQGGVTVVPDATCDPRFRENPLVTREAGVRFYAGAPLKTPDGYNLGTLCLIDTVPHAELTEEARDALTELAAMVVDELELRRARDTLQRTGEEFAHVLDSITDAVWSAEVSPAGVFAYRYYSPMVERLTGRPPRFFMAGIGNWLSVVYPEDRARLECAALGMASGETQREIEYRILHTDGTLRWVRDSVRALAQPDGAWRLYGVVSDVTERKEAERREALQAEFRRELIGLMETSLKRGLDSSFYGRLLACAARVIPGAQAGSLLLRDEQSRCTYVAAVDYDLEQLKRTYLWERELYRDPSRPGPQLIFDFGANRAMEPGRREQIYGSGRVAAIQVSLSIPVEVDGRTLAYFNLDNFDTTEAFGEDAVEMARVFAQQTAALLKRFELEGAFEHLAHHDPLTGKPNRRLFERRLQGAVTESQRSGKSLAVMLLDLNDFKSFNDTRGHAFGDAVLRGVAERLALCLREGDTLARWGGDEFVLLLPELSGAREATFVAERLLEAFRQPLVLMGQPVHVGVSLGIDLYPDGAAQTEELIRHADIALYNAKVNKHGYQVFTEAMDKRVQTRLALEADLREALDTGRLSVCYQPKVALTDERITSLEALARWHHPTRGWVSPATFVPLAEETGLIRQLGNVVLNLACAQARVWQEAGLARRVAVNLSAEQLRDPQLVEEVQSTLARYGLDPALLELEVTESTAMANVADGIVKLRRLRELGVYLAIDDFGTAYSSLAYLKQLPVHCLKIDRAFVKDLGEADAASGASIVQAIVALARSFELSVVAEGVETEAQRQALRALGCDEAQGYLFAKPLPPCEVTELLKKDRGKAPSPAAFAV